MVKHESRSDTQLLGRVMRRVLVGGERLLDQVFRHQHKLYKRRFPTGYRKA